MSNMMELKKGCKIVNEFILFLMHEGYTKVNIDVFQDAKAHYYTIKTNKVNKKILKFIEENIDVERQIALEEYGWELMGEGEGFDQFHLIGCFLDALEVENTDAETIFRMVRYVKY